MWHEARKQEKKIRGVMIDFQRRAERRREHYERTRGDPNQLLRVYGTQCKLHLDPTGGERDSTMIPWQGDPDNLISRYDVRIHMDLIPDYSKLPEPELSREEEVEEARCNYERYRALVLNTFKNVSDSDALAKIDVDEMYPVNTPSAKDMKSKLKSQAKAAIAFKYDDSSGEAASHLLQQEEEEEEEEDKDFTSESEYEIDMDVDTMFPAQVDKLNMLALSYGVSTGSFSSNLRVEKEQLEEQKLARLADLEKSNFSGKKARRERRLLKEKRVVGNRPPTPPSYASRSSPTYETYGQDDEGASSSHSRSASPVVGKVEYITEFGTEEPPPPPPPAPQPPSKQNRERKRSTSRGREGGIRGRGRGSPPSRGSSRQTRSKRSRSKDRSRHQRSSSWRRSERSRSRSRSRERRRRSRSDSSGDRRRRGRREGRSHSSGRRSRSHYSSRDGRRSPSRDERRSPSRGGRRSPSRGGRRSPSRGGRRSPSSSRSPSPRHRSSSSSSSSPSEQRRQSPSPPAAPQRTQGSPAPRRTQGSPSGSEEGGRTKVTEDNTRQSSPAQEESLFEDRKATPPEKPKGAVMAVKAKEKDKIQAKLTPQEKLKKRMQTQLNKQFRMDKKQQRLKEDQKEVERMEREDVLKEQTKKMKERDPYWEVGRSVSRSPSPRHNYDY